MFTTFSHHPALHALKYFNYWATSRNQAILLVIYVPKLFDSGCTNEHAPAAQQLAGELLACSKGVYAFALRESALT